MPPFGCVWHWAVIFGLNIEPTRAEANRHQAQSRAPPLEIASVFEATPSRTCSRASRQTQRRSRPPPRAVNLGRRRRRYEPLPPVRRPAAGVLLPPPSLPAAAFSSSQRTCSLPLPSHLDLFQCRYELPPVRTSSTLRRPAQERGERKGRASSSRAYGAGTLLMPFCPAAHSRPLCLAKLPSSDMCVCYLVECTRQHVPNI